MNLSDWRRRIDELDRKLVELLNERSRCAIEIGRLKRDLHLGIFDADRERQVVRNIQRANNGPLDNEGLQRLFERIIDECRRSERIESQKE